MRFFLEDNAENDITKKISWQDTGKKQTQEKISGGKKNTLNTMKLLEYLFLKSSHLVRV